MDYIGVILGCSQKPTKSYSVFYDDWISRAQNVKAYLPSHLVLRSRSSEDVIVKSLKTHGTLWRGMFQITVRIKCLDT